MSQCNRCRYVSEGLFSPIKIKQMFGKDFCTNCIKDFDSIQMTTTNSIDGRKIEKYIKIDSVEIVIGTGFFSEFSSSVSDFFGERSSAFETKLQKAKDAALEALKLKAFINQGDAVVAVDLDYMEFSGNRIGLTVNGTIVKLTSDSEI